MEGKRFNPTVEHFNYLCSLKKLILWHASRPFLPSLSSLRGGNSVLLEELHSRRVSRVNVALKELQDFSDAVCY